MWSNEACLCQPTGHPLLRIWQTPPRHLQADDSTKLTEAMASTRCSETACWLASTGNTAAGAADSSYYDWGTEVPVVAVGVNVGDDEQDNYTQGHCPFRSNWRCLCPRDHWQTVLERARSNDSTDWIQCAADGALALLRHAYELSEASECSCTFAGFQSFGGKKLTADDDLGDAFVVFDWAVGPRQQPFSSKVL